MKKSMFLRLYATLTAVSEVILSMRRSGSICYGLRTTTVIDDGVETSIMVVMSSPHTDYDKTPRPKSVGAQPRHSGAATWLSETITKITSVQKCTSV